MSFKGATKVLGVALAISLSTPSHASAELDCISFADNYNSKVSEYNQATNPPMSQFKELGRLKRDAEKNRQECVREINRQFKSTIQEINTRLPKGNGDKKKGAVDKVQRSAQVTAATLERDTKIGQIPNIQELPPQKKFIKEKNQKGIKR